MLLLFLLCVDGVSGAETEAVSVIEGDSVTLHGNLTEILNDDTILWKFGPKGSFISQIKRKADFTSIGYTEDAKFKGRLQVDQNTGSLTIRNTRIRHSGQYQISISRKTSTSKMFNVTVQRVVSGTNGVKSKSVSVMEGESVTLDPDKTQIQGDDLVLWMFEDKGILLAKIDVETKETSLNDADEGFRGRLKMDDQTGSLTITNTRTSDSGLYELQIRGSDRLQKFILTVSQSGLSPGAKTGIVFAVLLFVVAAVGGVIYHRHTISELQKRIRRRCSFMFDESSTPLRLVLVGLTGAGKSSSGNTILGRKAFRTANSPSSVTKECSKETENVAGREIAVVDTPGMFDTDLSQEELLKQKISKCINMTAPGPHAIILVIKLDMFIEEERHSVEKIRAIFGEEADKHTMVLFTHSDELTGSIEDFIEANEALKEVLNRCGGGYHVFNNEDMQNRNQVVELLQKIDAVVAANGDEHYTSDLYQDVENMLKPEDLKKIYKEELQELEARFAEEVKELQERIKTQTASEQEKEKQIREFERLNKCKMAEYQRYYKAKLREARQEAEQTCTHPNIIKKTTVTIELNK